MSENEMTEEEYEADEDLQAYLHSKASKKAEQNMNDRMLEREEEQKILAEQKAEEDRLAKEKFDREEKERILAE